MKIEHDDIEYKLSQLIDGDLADDQARALRERIAAEPALAETYRRYQALQQRLDAAGEAEAPVDWDLQAETIRMELERDALLAPRKRFWSARPVRWAAGVAAAAAVVVAATLLWPLFAPTEPPAELAVNWSDARAPGPAAVRAEVLGADAAGAGELFVRYDEPTTAEMARPKAMRPAPPAAPLRGTIVIATGAGRVEEPSAELIGL